MKPILWAAVAAVALTSVLILWRHFFWQHAAIIGLAVAALVYSSFRAYERLRTLHKR